MELGDKWRVYNIPYVTVPSFHFEDPRAEMFIALRKPVVLTGSNVVKPALKWDLDYLKESIKNEICTVVVSPNHVFKYHNENAINSITKSKKFIPPTERIGLKFTEFVDKLKNWKEGEKRLYLQQSLTNSLGIKIAQDYLKFDMEWINKIRKKNLWGHLTSNLLLIGMEGNVTPCHYDEQENLFAQLKGTKRIILFPPQYYECLYPYTISHPHDRQSQVDFENPDYDMFPRFKEVIGEVGFVKPGDILYIPSFWWHHVESPMNEGYTVSVNCWHKNPPTKEIVYPLQPYHKLTIMRNIEKILLEALKDPEEVRDMLRAIVIGRYTQDYA